jgi:rhamnosyl/mannosyltransferase
MKNYSPNFFKGLRTLQILQVNKLYHPVVGGVEQHVQNLAEGLSSEADVEVLASAELGLGSIEKINDIPVTRTFSLGKYFSMPVSPTLPLKLYQKMSEFDLIHLHIPFPLGVVSIVPFLEFKRNRDTKVVATWHMDIVHQKMFLPFYKPILNRFFTQVDRILCTSPQMKKSSEFFSGFQEKIEVLPYSIDFDEFTKRKDKNIEIEIPEKDLILFVGRLVPYKGTKYLVEAIKNIDAELYIAGDGELREELESQVDELELRDKINFLGMVKDREKLKYLYQHADLFVLPSVLRNEAFGIVQLEAMSYGTPVINTSIDTGVPYPSLDGQTGYTVPPRDSQMLTEKINELLKDESTYEKFSQNAKERVREKFSRQVMIDSALSIYQDVLDE